LIDFGKKGNKLLHAMPKMSSLTIRKWLLKLSIYLAFFQTNHFLMEAPGTRIITSPREPASSATWSRRCSRNENAARKIVVPSLSGKTGQENANNKK